MKRALPFAVATSVVLGLSGRADAQAPQMPDVLPAQEGSGPNPDTPGEPKKPSIPAAGYAFKDKPATSGKGVPRVNRVKYRRTGPVVAMPGFEQTSDGGSRLFVQLSQTVPVEERKTPGTITYVLKGASPRVWNNTNALVTVHFNTPVYRARLVPQGQDLHFVVELRAEATPTWKMNEAAGDKPAMLAIDFPKGDYLNGPAPATPRPAPAKAARTKRTSKPAPPKP
jgi:hypothetical protein